MLTQIMGRNRYGAMADDRKNTGTHARGSPGACFDYSRRPAAARNETFGAETDRRSRPLELLVKLLAAKK